jgi:hypothetical protein
MGFLYWLIFPEAMAQMVSGVGVPPAFLRFTKLQNRRQDAGAPLARCLFWLNRLCGDAGAEEESAPHSYQHDLLEVKNIQDNFCVSIHQHDMPSDYNTFGVRRWRR